MSWDPPARPVLFGISVRPCMLLKDFLRAMPQCGRTHATAFPKRTSVEVNDSFFANLGSFSYGFEGIPEFVSAPRSTIQGIQLCMLGSLPRLREVLGRGAGPEPSLMYGPLLYGRDAKDRNGQKSAVMECLEGALKPPAESQQPLCDR